MATVKTGIVTHTWFMSNKNTKSPSPKTASVTHYVAANAVAAYNGAADDAARAATAIGALLAAEDALTLGVTSKVDVGFSYVDSAAIPPSVDVMAYAFDKIGVNFRADGENYVSSIPARVKDNNIIGLSSDGVTINISPGTTEIQAYISAFQAVVLSEELAVPTITNMDVKS